MMVLRRLIAGYSNSADKRKMPLQCEFFVHFVRNEEDLYNASGHPLLTLKSLGLPLDACTRYADYMTAAGFVDVVEKRFKMPTSAWPKEKRLKLIGAFEMHNLVKGVSAMSLRMFNKAYGWSREQIEMFLTQVRKDTQNVRCKLYPNISTTCVRILMGS